MKTIHRFAATAALTSAVTLSSLAAQTVRTHVSNGSTANNYDVVFIGDGYRASEETQFVADVEDCIDYWRDQARVSIPYGDYFQSHNFHSVFRASLQSGIDRPAEGIVRNTAYGATYGATTVRCITLNTAGRTRAMNDRALAPGTETLILVLANDTQYGGCASGGIACQYNGSSMEDVLIHEWSHIYGSLADEYDGDSSCFSGSEPSAVNVTANGSGNKWSQWLGRAGPNSTVGTFEGAQYYDRCKWRPESDCEMRNLNRRFCAVCRERLIRLHHQRTNMVYSPSASTTNITATQYRPRSFSVFHNLPAATASFEWRIDGGTWVVGTDRFRWEVGNTSVGSHTVQCRARDITPWVRIGTSGLITVKTWNVTVNAGSLEDSDFREILPDTITNTPGNSATGFPFNQSSEQRVMYAYGRNAISPEHPVEIRGLQFRPNEGAGAWAGGTYNFELDVSTSRTAAGNLSRTFDTNHGADKVRVWEGAITVPGGSLGATPNPFIIEIPFTRAFQWNPCSGPLLLDFRFRGLQSGTGITCDAQGSATDSTVGRIANTGDADAASANFPTTGTQNIALVTNLILDCGGAPASLVNTAGGSSSSYPWGRVGQSRVQYVYDGNIVGLGGINQKISRLAWRTNENAGYSGNRTFNVRVTLSTGAAGLSTGLNSTFDANHGPDRTVVYDGTWRPGATALGSSPSPFNQVMELQRTFDYSPDAGALVVDIQVRSASSTTSAAWDGELVAGSGYGRVFSGVSANATSGTTQSFALAMCVSAVPQPIAPATNDGAFGTSGSSFPWNSSNAQRAMYFYDPSAGISSQNITNLSWRIDDAAGDFGPVTYSATIDLSTADAFLDSGFVTTTFNDNHGDDRLRVFSGSISVPYIPAGSDPKDFQVSVKLDRPFFWDGSGALVVDIRKAGGFVAGAANQAFDGSGEPNDVARIVHQSNRNATVADFGPQDFGLALKLGGDGNNARVDTYGAGCVGQNGVPIGSTLSRPWTGNRDFGFALYDGPRSAPAALLVGSTSTSIPLGVIGVPCDLLVGNIFASVSRVTDGAGNAVVASGIPADPSQDGTRVRFQWAMLDRTAPGQITTSNGNTLVIEH